MCLIAKNLIVCEVPKEELEWEDRPLQGMLWNVYRRDTRFFVSGPWYEDTARGALGVALSPEDLAVEEEGFPPYDATAHLV